MSQRIRGQPTILVTDAGRGSAISIIRSLGRKGWNVIAADSNSHSPGFYSRYAQGTLLYPAPQTAPHEFVATIFEAVQNRGVDLIIPVTDEVILPLAAAQAQLEGVCRLALPEAAALEIVTNKLKTLELAMLLKVPVPGTCLVHTTQEARTQGAVLGWPLVLKPQTSRLYRDQAAVEAFSVCYADSPERLVEQMQRFEGRCPVLLQEYTEGIGQGVELLMCQGQPLAVFQHKRLREVPINGGASAFRESARLDPLLYDYSVRLLRALNWTGLAMVEFKVGRSGAKLMEINGRVWGSLPLAVHSGMDFPARLVELLLYGPPKASTSPASDYVIGLRARTLELELIWIATVLRGKRRYPFLAIPSRWQGMLALMELLNPTYKFDILSLEDLRPGLAEILKIIGKFEQKLKRNGMDE